MQDIPTRTRAASAAALCGLLLAGSLFVALSAGAANTPPPPLVSLVTVQNGTTHELGGGDYLFVHAGQATFGVVYGSPEHPNGSVTFVAMIVRSLGTAEVRDAGNGKVLRENQPLPVTT